MPENITRILDIRKEVEKKSCFLFGPRLTGKTWLLRHTLKNIRTYNLLDHDTFLRLSRSASLIGEECTARDSIVVIDEVQKLPSLLDAVHMLIEERGIHFLLTGSSARKLRRGGVNLLGGRARIRNLYPLSFSELQKSFNLERAVNHGLLPAIYSSQEPDEDLKAYVGTYLQEEVAAEGLTRNIPAFSRFLEVAALCNGKMINFANIANDAQVARSTVQEYFQILKDTLLAHEVPAWRKSVRRKPITTSKFYLFDSGVARILQHRGRINPGSPEFGEAFEHFIFHELLTYADYCRAGEIRYWRSLSGFEVDFVLGDTAAIEVKAGKNVSPQDLKGLRALREEGGLKHYLMVSGERTARVIDGIRILPWKEFLQQLWDGRFS